MQVARGGVGGALFFCQAYLSPHGNISSYFGRLKVFFPALYRCMEILWTAACFQKTHLMGTQHLGQCTTQVGISVLNEMER